MRSCVQNGRSYSQHAGDLVGQPRSMRKGRHRQEYTHPAQAFDELGLSWRGSMHRALGCSQPARAACSRLGNHCPFPERFHRPPLRSVHERRLPQTYWEAIRPADFILGIRGGLEGKDWGSTRTWSRDMADSNSPFWWYQTGTTLVYAHAKPVQLRRRMDWILDWDVVFCTLDAI